MFAWDRFRYDAIALAAATDFLSTRTKTGVHWRHLSLLRAQGAV